MKWKNPVVIAVNHFSVKEDNIMTKVEDRRVNPDVKPACRELIKNIVLKEWCEKELKKAMHPKRRRED